MKFNPFKNNRFSKGNEDPKINYLYEELNPGNRIDSLLKEYLNPILEPKEFKFIKSKRGFVKKDEFFDFCVSWNGRKFNYSNKIVKFQLYFGLFSPKYRKWEKKFYQLEKNSGNAIDGCEVHYLKEWDLEYCDSGWYDLVKYDNKKLMEKIVENSKNAGFNYFHNFKSLDSAIEKLKEYPKKNFIEIIDFYILQEKWREANDFFESNKQWFEEKERVEGSDPDSYYSINLRTPFKLRIDMINNRLE